MTFSDWWNNLYNTLFGSNSSSSSGYSNSSKTTRRNPKNKNLTFDETVNTALTKGLWHNSVDGYKLGASLCFNPIQVPLSFMGFPHFDILDQEKVSNLEFWEERLKFYNENYIIARKNIQRLCHRDGTSIIWPWFDSNVGYVRWKFIEPGDVWKILVDAVSEEINTIITDVEINIYSDTGVLKTYQEKTFYTKSKIIIKRTGTLPDGLRAGEVRRNPIKMLPIVFANNREPGEFEGHSDYERIIPFIKAYSETNLSAHETLKNLGPKLIQTVDDKPNKWLTNNGYTNLADVDVSEIDFIINKNEKENSEFLIPEMLIDGHIKLLEMTFYNIVEASAIPEIVWGLKTEGNHASAAEQMGVLLSFVDNKQTQANGPYLELINATAELEALANTQTRPENIIASWQDLDALNETERSEIFKNYADGITILLEKSTLDLQSAHKLLHKLTNGMITTDFEEFEKGIIEYGTITAFLEQEYSEIRTSGEPVQNKIKPKSEKHSNGVKGNENKHEKSEHVD